jgi:hypothetical protein
MERELEIGRQITRFLTENIPAAGVEVVAHFDAAREVAGDFYDVINLPSGKIALVLGDVLRQRRGSGVVHVVEPKFDARVFGIQSQHRLDDGFINGMATTFNVTDQSGMRCLRRVIALLAVEMVNDYIAYNHGDMVMFSR